MGLGTYEQNLIKSIAENDIREAKKWAVAALNADTTQKNKWFVTRYKNILTSEGAGLMELPGNLKDHPEQARQCLESIWHTKWDCLFAI